MFCVETLVCRTSSNSRARDDANFSNSFPERRSRAIRRVADCSDVSGLYAAPRLAAQLVNSCFSLFAAVDALVTPTCAQDALFETCRQSVTLNCYLYCHDLDLMVCCRDFGSS